MRQSFKMAIKNILSNKMRSFLTMLGIIIGVASVIILVGLVEGQMNYIRASFSDMGTNQLQVQLTNTPTRSVSPQDLYAFYDKNRAYYKEISPQVPVKATIKHKTDKLTKTRISGVSEQFYGIDAKKLEAGRYIQYSDIASRQPVCVLGISLPRACLEALRRRWGRAYGLTEMWSRWWACCSAGTKTS